jgi:hypothetical protein
MLGLSGKSDLQNRASTGTDPCPESLLEHQSCLCNGVQLSPRWIPGNDPNDPEQPQWERTFHSGSSFFEIGFAGRDRRDSEKLACSSF